MSSNKVNELKNTQKTDGAGEQLLPIVLPEHVKDFHTKNEAIPFSEALQLIKFGKFNYFLIFISGIILSNVVLETGVMGYILAIAQCDLQLSNQDKGVLSAIGSAGIIVSSHLWGFLADTKGRRRIMYPTLIAGFIITVFSSFSHTFWMMVLLRFLNGFFISGGSATIFAYLGEFHTDKTRSRAVMCSSFIFAVGVMMLPLIAFLVINQDWTLPMPFLGIVYKPWRLFLIVCGIPGCLCGLSMYFLPESPKFLLSIGKEAEAIEILQKMNVWNGGTEPLKIKHIEPDFNEIGASALLLSKDITSTSNIVVTYLQTMWQQTVPLFHRKYLRTTLIVCTIQFWLYVVSNGMCMWLPHIINSMVEFMKNHPGEHTKICQIVYAKEESLYKEDGTMECVTKLQNTTYFYYLIMEILYACNFAIIGVIINRVGKIPILFTTIIFFTACGLASVFVTDPFIASYLYLLLFPVGSGVNVLGATTVELYPTNLRAMAMCISLMFGRLGSVVGANIVGAMLATNCELTFYIPCVALFICAFLALLIPRKTMDKVAQKTADLEM